MKSRKKVLYLCQAAIIAALYAALTVLSSLFGLSSGAIQCRFSEALCVLPYFTPAAIPGVTLGCLISNLTVAGTSRFDIIFGTLATLIGALGTYLLRKVKIGKFLSALPPVVSNTLIIPFVLKYAYNIPDGIGFLMLTVGLGELISAGVLGTLLLLALEPYKERIFK